ncbi:MAG: family 20 glycosylhydrolase, partial [Candidatus Neomarinimicrobiota bacterium]
VVSVDEAAVPLIRLALDPAGVDGGEGYRLTIDSARIRLTAAQPAGLFYGCQTLRQLLPVRPDDRDKTARAGEWAMPGLNIDDSPRFAWRGMMLDVSRHFFPKKFIFELLDYLALHKLNVFHWHLVDDQGWRIEIKRYPRLTEVGAWRVDRPEQFWSIRQPQQPGEQANYGGYYTQEEIREVVEYARQRFITVVPEIEMPAHVTCALAAYPELSCTGGPFTVPSGSIWPLKDIYCAGRDSTFEFLENVLTEVIALFPGEYIHIGGDEAHKGEWERCDSCQTRIKTEGLQDETELQSYFVKRIERFLQARGKKLIGWDEILEGGLAPEATVMSWRGTEGGIAAAKSGHSAVMSPVSHCYLNCYQGNLDLEPPGQSGYLPLTKVYSYDPVPTKLNRKQAKLILGAQANLWAEFVPNPHHAEYMLFPRLSALAEVLWSPQAARSWDDFSRRLTAFFPLYEMYGINYSTSARQVRIESKRSFLCDRLKITMDTELPGLAIHYTSDGSQPDRNSALYDKPLTVTGSTQIQAVAVRDGEVVSPVTELIVQRHSARGRRVKLAKPWHWRYSGGGRRTLTDGIRANDNYRNRHWQGFRVDDLEATIKLGRSTVVNTISAGFLQYNYVGIFMPTQVEFALSLDGKDFRVIDTVETGVAPDQPGAIIKNVTVAASGQEARYLRVRAKNIGQCPDWHPGAGKDAYLFVDEVVVE